MRPYNPEEEDVFFDVTLRTLHLQLKKGRNTLLGAEEDAKGDYC